VYEFSRPFLSPSAIKFVDFQTALKQLGEQRNEMFALLRVVRFFQLTSRHNQLHTRADQIFGHSKPLNKIPLAFNRVNACTVSENQEFILQS
jgi:hypothetical protein